MFEAPAATEPRPADPHEARAERRLRLLQELAEIGMELARDVRAQAQAQAPAADPAAGERLSLTFSRIARAVRQTLALEARLDRDRQASAVERAKRLADEAAVRMFQRKSRVRELVDRAIEAEASGEAAEDLRGDLDERLEDADDLAAFAERPIGEIVARICRDLGVAPPPDLWDDAGWEIAEASPEIASGPDPSPPPGEAASRAADAPRAAADPTEPP